MEEGRAGGHLWGEGGRAGGTLWRREDGWPFVEEGGRAALCEGRAAHCGGKKVELPTVEGGREDYIVE